MSEEHQERILDACLEEVLGGHYPPDLTAKILQTWQARQRGATLRDTSEYGPASLPIEPVAGAAELVTPAAAAPVPPPVHYDYEPEPPPVQLGTVVHVTPRPYARRSTAPWWVLIPIAGALAASLLLLVHVVQRPPQPASNAVAERGTAKGDAEPAAIGGARKPGGRTPRPGALPPRGTGPDEQLAGPAGHGPGTEALPTVAAAAHAPRPAPRAAPRPQRQPSADATVIAFVDDALRHAWREHGVTPSPPENDEQWCQRVYDRLVGRAPTSDEVTRFVKDRTATKRADLVEQLLASADYARHWAGFWSQTLLGPATEGESKELVDRAGLTDYLTAALAAGRPYDQIATELLAAGGSNRPGGDDYNGAVNFLLAGAANQAVPATDRVARVFLGRQLICARCHDHPTSGWQQNEFWQLNAFFRQMRVWQQPGAAVAILADGDFVGETGTAADAEIFYREPDGRLRAAYPQLDQHALAHSGRLNDVHRRRELAALVVAADDFPRAVVNRVWAYYLGYGFVQPVDDLGPHNPPAQPEVLQRLADELAAHDFDLRRLSRWIVLSAPFGLSNRRMPESWMDAPERGTPPLFARFYGKPGDGKDVQKALLLAVNTKPAPTSLTPGQLARRSWPSTGNLEIIATQPGDLAVDNGWLGRLAASALRPEQKVEHVFLSALGRKPSPRELTAAKLLLADRLNDAVALPEIYRTLLASDEGGRRSGSR